MTDATDIEALRRRSNDLRTADQTDAFIDLLLDKLEAERQRAVKLDDRAKCAEAERDKNIAWHSKQLKRANDLEAELAALKGDQVLVAYTDTLSLETLQGNGMACMWKQGNGAEWREQIPLFTTSQKPVVHPDTKRMDWLCAHCVEVRDPQMYGSHAMFHAQQDSEEWDLPHHTTLREQVDAAIEAAGGKVQS